MALVSFGYRVDMFAIDPPLEVGAYIVAYDLDGVLKQKDHLGVVTLVGAGAGGPQGPPGPVGPAGLTWSGTWMATQSYSLNYAVGYGSASWWCISDVTGATSNTGPDVDTTHWALLAAQGSPGSQGGTGSQGLQGPQGEIGLNWLGDWIVNVYDVRDAVYYNGSSYVCIASTVGSETVTPDVNSACWDLISSKGDVGATGSQGATGSILQDIFYNIGGTVSATNSTTAIYRTGSINIGTGTASDSRFVVSSSGGTTSMIVGETGTTTLIYNSPYSYNLTNNTLVIKNPNGSAASMGVTTDSNLRISAPGMALLNGSDELWFGRFGQASIQSYSGPLVFYNGSGETMRIMNVTGNVGIGTSSPSTKLHIYATQSGAFRLQDGTQGSGRILISDANGVASWTASSSSSSTLQTAYNNSTDGKIITDATRTAFKIKANSTFNNQLEIYNSSDTLTGWISDYTVIFRYYEGWSFMGGSGVLFGTDQYNSTTLRATSGPSMSNSRWDSSTRIDYLGDYSQYYTNRSLVDKGYVNSLLYWTATGSNIINSNNSTVIVSGPTASGEIAIKSPNFIGAAELTGFGIYNSGTVAGTYFYGSWFNSAPGYGLQDFTAQTKFYIDATTFNWVSNKPISIGTGTASNSRFLVSSSGGTVSLIVAEDGSVYNRGGGNDNSNTAFGDGALVLNTPDGGGYGGANGTNNTAIGTGALYTNTTGYSNMAIGAYSLYYANSTYNVAIGGSALQNNTSGEQNMAIGAFSLYYNQTGDRNTAIGTSALQNNFSNYNTAIGNFSGVNITYGSSNILIGFQSGSNITTGINNTIIAETGYSYTNGITTGSNNLIVAQNHGNATGITTGSNNTIIGKVTGLATGLSSSVILSDGLGNIRFYSDNNGNVGLGTTSPTASAIFQIESTTKGFLPPRMTNTQRTSISTPAIGLMVYCTDTTEGLYVYKSTGWQFIV